MATGDAHRHCTSVGRGIFFMRYWCDCQTPGLKSETWNPARRRMAMVLRRISTPTVRSSILKCNNAAFFSSTPHIAVDFGTSKSRVAVMENNGSAAPKVIRNSRYQLIPTDSKGVPHENAEITGWKPLFGTPLSDHVENAKIINEVTGDMLISLLSMLKQEAESYLKTSVSRAVLTYPLYFTPSWLRQMVKAGLNTGFDKMHTLDDPTAAAIAYGLNKKEPGWVFAVIDFGCWSFDISIMEVSANGRFVFKEPTKSDMSFGGEVFDEVLVDYLLVTKGDMTDECRVMLQRKDTLEASKTLGSAQRVFEGHKIKLSSTFETHVIVPRPYVVPGGPTSEFIVNTTLTRTKFESLVNHLFEKMRNSIENYLKEARVSPKDIDEVLLVGGMAHVPQVRKIVRNIFGKLPTRGISNLDEPVVLGAAAAVQAGHFGHDPWND